MFYQKRFEKEAIEYFKTRIPDGAYQAIDGIEVFSPLGEYRFLRARLNYLVNVGVLKNGPSMKSIFMSYDGTPTYGLYRGPSIRPGYADED